MATASKEFLQRVQEHTFRELPGAKLESVNLYVDSEVRERGQPIGPEYDKIVAKRPTIVVFVDEAPHANFSHPCRYRLYDAEKGELYDDTPARFPPYVKAVPETFYGFHLPVEVRPNPDIFTVRPWFRCPVIFPDGNRYAILFAGMSNRRHINDIEFLYRTLVDIYAFPTQNIQVLTYDGTLNTQDGIQTNWPGDGSAYRMQITGRGDQAGLEAAIDQVKSKLKSQDMLLIHTNNHGGYDGPGQSYLCTYPNWGRYYASDFGNKLAQLPAFRALIVMMEQCHSGGFNNYVINNSTADATSIASAAVETASSYVSADGNWDPFARDWIAAQAGHTATGGALNSNPDVNGDGKIQAIEAYNYAVSVQDPLDTPNYNQSSAAGGDITLGQQYLLWWLWCPILIRYLEPHYWRLSPEKFYAIVNNGVAKDLRQMAHEVDKITHEAGKMAEVRLEEIVKRHFR